MKKFNEIKNFKTIKCAAKISTDTLTELQRQANEIIFKYNMQYAFPCNVQRAYEELEKVFIAIKELEVKNSASAKKEEILTMGRQIARSLKNYSKEFKYDATCTSAIESMCKFQLSKYLKSKDSLTITDAIKLLEENQALYRIVEDVTEQLNTKVNAKTFIRMQQELIELIIKRLQEYSFN